MGIYPKLLALRAHPRFGRAAYYALKALGVELPLGVEVGRNLTLVHGSVGLVVHPCTVIEDDVRIYQGVTIGRGDVHRAAENSRFESIRIERGAVLGAGAKILCSEGVLVVGAGSVIGANSVLTRSTGAGEIWAGMPARCVGRVED